MSQQNETITQKTKIMKTLNINDIVKLTNLIKDASSKGTDQFALLSSGDRVSLLPFIYGEVAHLRVYLNEDRLETAKVHYLADGEVSNVKTVNLIEKIDEKVSK